MVVGKGRGGAGMLEKTYEEAAAFGRLMAVIGLVVGCVVGVLCIGGGIYLLIKKPVHKSTSTVSHDESGKPVTVPIPETSQSSKPLAIFLIVFGILVAIGMIIRWYIVTQYKFAAAASGVGDAIGITGDAVGIVGEAF
jgi:flagellar basal body-associated protein FliL